MAIALSTSVETRSSGATVLLPFISANAANSLLTLSIAAGTAAPPSTVTDSAGNTWLLAVSSTRSAPALSNQIWYAPNAVGSTNTITITSGDATTQINCFAQEWTGCSTASPEVGTNAHILTTASTHTPGAVSAAPSTVVYIVNYSFSNAFDITTGPTSYTQANSTFPSMETYYRIVSGSTATENPEAVSSATENSVTVMAAFSGGAASLFMTKRRRALCLLGVS